MKTQKIILYDLETSPNISYTWDGMFDINVAQYKHEWRLLSFSYKVLGESKIHGMHIKDAGSEKKLVQELHNMLSSADIIVAHNGISFDNKKSNAKFLEFNLTPPKPYKTIDTLKVLRKHFKLNSNSLNNVCEKLGLGGKLKHEGIQLWVKCMDGDKKSLDLLKKYNKRDVELLEELYVILRPWINNHPNVNEHEELACPKCGSHKLSKQGLRRQTNGLFQQYKCGDCGGWSQHTQKENKSKRRPVKNL